MNKVSDIDHDRRRPEPAAQKEPVRWICLELVLLVVLVYGRVAWYDWVYFDDNAYVFENPTSPPQLHTRQAVRSVISYTIGPSTLKVPVLSF